MFLRQHRIATGRHHGARHDAHALAAHWRQVGGAAGVHGADHVQCRRMFRVQLVAGKGKAVHRRIVVGGHADRRHDIVRQHAAQRGAQRHFLDAPHGLHELADDPLRLLHGHRIRVVRRQPGGNFGQSTGLFALQLVQRIDVAERAGIGEQHLGHFQCARPAFHAALAAGQIGFQLRQRAFLHQRKHRVALPARTFQRDGDRHVGTLCDECLMQPRHQVVRQERRIAGGGRQQVRLAMAQAGLQAGEGTFVARQFVRQHLRAQCGVGVHVAVRADRHGGHLRRQPRQHEGGQRGAAKMLQTLVDAAHPRAAAAGQDQAADSVLAPQLIPLYRTSRPCARPRATGRPY